MRFTADGVDIPDELLWAQDEGRVVFFCGAGVSRAKALLPDFDGLTEQVLNKLGALPDDEARKLHEWLSIARRDHGIAGLASSDQVFQLLRRNFTDADIGAKAAESLKPANDVDLSAHAILLRLAKLQTGETRIVTTNFDRLFEQCDKRIASVTRSTLPHLAFNEANWGIVHLHGCVNKDYSGPTRDGFVLSSAEFGDAYLAMGWARDFVKGILDRFVAVFVGYSADDPPIRYLLEGLRQSNGPTNRAYAFQSGPNDQAVASWDEKGVQALLYETNYNCGHRRLWESLDAWSERNVSPARWGERTLRMARKGPVPLAPHERGMIAHIVSSRTGANSFANRKPALPAEWLCVLDQLVRYGEARPVGERYSGGPTVDPFQRYRLDSDPPPRPKEQRPGGSSRVPDDVWSALNSTPDDLRELDSQNVASIRGYYAGRMPRLVNRLTALAWWIGSVADQPAAVWWAGQQYSLHPEILEHIKLRLKPTTGRVQRIVTDAWQAILEYHDLKSDERDHLFDLRFSPTNSEWEAPQIREYARQFSPRLKLETSGKSPIPPAAGSLKLRDLVSLEIDYPEHILSVQVPDEALTALIPKLRTSLEVADDLEARYKSYHEISSIEPDAPSEDEDDDDSYERQYKLSGRVVSFAGLFRRLAALHPDAARAELNSWPHGESRVFERLRVWALGNLTIAPAEQFAEELLTTSAKSFWPFRGERDLLLGLSKRWNEIDKKRRLALENRIRRGPPKYKRLESEHAAHSAHRVLSRINWLNANGCEFSFDLNVLTKQLRTKAPEWKPEYAAHAADSHEGKGGWVRTETDSSELENLEASQIIAHADAIARRPSGFLVERDPFLGLSRTHPLKALAALNASGSANHPTSSYWQTFLRQDIRANDSDVFKCEIARSLLKLSNEKFLDIIRGASDWFEKSGPGIEATESGLFESLWKKFLRALRGNQNAIRSSLVRKDHSVDWASEAINSAAGKLAQLVVDHPPQAQYEPGSTLPKAWLARIDQLLALPDDSRRYALVIVGHQLRWLYSIDPGWTNTNVLTLFEDSSAENDSDREAVFAGLFWNAHVPQPPLFRRLKAHLVAIASSRSYEHSHNLEIVAGILLAGWGMKDGDNGEPIVTSTEFRQLLIEAGAEFRQRVLGTLDRWSDASEASAERVATFLREVWPRQKSIRTPQSSAKLCEIALSQKHHFPEIVAVVTTLVSKVGDDRVFIPELRKTEETLAIQYPNEMLGLLHAILPDNRSRWPYGADVALRALAEGYPSIRSDPRFIELEAMPL